MVPFLFLIFLIFLVMQEMNAYILYSVFPQVLSCVPVFHIYLCPSLISTRPMQKIDSLSSLHNAEVERLRVVSASIGE